MYNISSNKEPIKFFFSPPGKSQKNDESDVNILTLAQFTIAPKISFGSVQLNSSVTKQLIIKNPQYFKVKLTVTCKDLKIDNVELNIEKNAEISLDLSWQPTEIGPFKYKIVVEVVDANAKFLVHAFGNCTAAAAPKKFAKCSFKKLKPKLANVRYDVVDKSFVNKTTQVEELVLNEDKSEIERKRNYLNRDNELDENIIHSPSKKSFENFESTPYESNQNGLKEYFGLDQSNLPSSGLCFNQSSSLMCCQNNESSSCNLTKNVAARCLFETIPEIKINSPKVPIHQKLTDSPQTPRLSEFLFSLAPVESLTEQHATIVQRHWRMKKFRRAVRSIKLNKAAIVVQAQWKMILTRRRYKININFKQNDPIKYKSKTLQARLTSAMLILDHYAAKSIPQLLECFTDLKTTTQLSPECCELFASKNRTTKLFKIISACKFGYKHEHMNLINECLKIMINLAKYPKSISCLIEPNSDSLQILLNLLGAYKIYNSDIFMNVCVLMLLLNRHGCFNETFISLNERKTLIEQLLSLQSTFSSQKPANKSSSNSKREYNLEPDWKLTKSKLVLYQDSLQALESLLAELGCLF